MNETVREWLAKAQGDFISAGRELRARKSPNYDSACFHAQQRAEKVMKALLIDRKIAPPKTHHLVELHQIIGQIESSWIWDPAELEWLGRAAVSYRYPGNTATREHAKTAIRLCRQLRERLLGMFS